MTSLFNQQLFTEAYLREFRDVKFPPDIADACRQTMGEWREEFPGLDDRTNLLSYLGQCLSALGLSYERRENPDSFVLYSDETHSQALSICLVTTDEQIGRTTKGRYYHAQLLWLLKEQNLSWGILTNGKRWRLCHARANAPYEVYLEADLDALLDRTKLPEFLVFYHFFNRKAFEYSQPVDAPAAVQNLDQMLSESDKRTQLIERHLKSRVDSILQALCLGFVADEAAPTYDREKLDEIYQNTIYLLYRVLFLFYAEARSLLPVAQTEYQRASLAAIVEDARLRQVKGEQNADPHSLWKRLTHLFVIVDDGDEALGVRPYNGGLFSDSEKPYLIAHKITDNYLAPALFDLAYVSGKQEPQPIDYRDLSVRHLGTLYEGMLEYRLNIVATEPVVVRESGGKRVYLKQSEAGPIKRNETILAIGQVYFADDKGERKSSGSYYTPEDVVQYIVSNSVLPKLTEQGAAVEAIIAESLNERDVAATPEERRRIERYIDRQVMDVVERKVLHLRILDPAMGSGHFLVAAGQMVANFIVELLNTTDWPNDELDCAPLDWKRRVVERCLYGVDLNPLALELAKLALWISSASEGKPLTFLDHHLKSGNSLYGTPLERLGSLPTAKQTQDDPMFRMLREAVISSLLRDLAEITDTDSDTIGTVKQKGEVLKQAEAKATRLRDVANVWLASLFGLTGSDERALTHDAYVQIHNDLTVNYAPEAWESRVHTDKILREARVIAKTEQFFHWELEFADAVADGKCAFDVVVANPPYVKTPPNTAISSMRSRGKKEIVLIQARDRQ